MSIKTSIMSPLTTAGSLGKPWMVAVLGMATFCVGAVQAQTLFGNLGADGSGSLAATNTDIGATSGTYLAQGIVAGSAPIGSVTLGLYGDGNQTASVTIYPNDSGYPNAFNPVASSGNVTVNAQGKYTFNFAGGVALTPGDIYWIVPNGNVSWYFAGGGFTAAPTAQNGSDYEWAGTLTATDTYFMSGSTTVPGYSISINPVPEPASMGIAGLALVGAAVALRRRGAAAK